MVIKSVPYSEIEDLDRYDFDKQTDYFTVKVNAYHQTHFTFKKNTGPLYKNYSYGLLAEPKDYDIVKDWVDALETLSLRKGKLLNDYSNLINAAYSFEELCEVWQEAEVMRDSIEGRAGKRAISCLSEEAL